MNSHKLFLGAAALVALHVVDDSFLQPQPGTSAADHLVSGLVPLALIGLAAAPSKEIWEIAEAGHVGGLEARPAEYERRVTGFFDRALLR